MYKTKIQIPQLMALAIVKQAVFVSPGQNAAIEFKHEQMTHPIMRAMIGLIRIILSE